MKLLSLTLTLALVAASSALSDQLPTTLTLFVNGIRTVSTYGKSTYDKHDFPQGLKVAIVTTLDVPLPDGWSLITHRTYRTDGIQDYVTICQLSAGQGESCGHDGEVVKATNIPVSDRIFATVIQNGAVVMNAEMDITWTPPTKSGGR
jgi:hypothetical protein